jgi:TetR/AcrR family transcriptional regulator
LTAEGQTRSIPPDAHEREQATMSTRRYDPEAAREDILDSAERLFAAKGFDGVSTAAIAKEAGVSQSQIHYHFETKKRLWDKVFERRFADYFAAQSSLLDNPQMKDMERMRQSIVSYFEFFEKYPHYVRLLTRAQLDLGEDGASEGDPAEEMGEMLMRKGSGVIAEAQRAGRIRDDIRPDFAIIGFLSLVAHWFMSGHHLMVETKDEKDREAHDREYLDFIIRVYLRGLAPE